MWIVGLGIGIATFIASMALLQASPKYLAQASITIKPSEAELSHSQTVGRIYRYDPTAILTQTYIEQFLSRPVAEKTLALLKEGQDPNAEKKSDSFVGALVGRLKLNFWYFWHILNYGEFKTASAYEQELADLRKSINIQLVQGSYIILIEVTHKNPELAARAANTLAEGYVQQAQEYLQVETNALKKSVMARIGLKQQALEDLLAKRSDLLQRLSPESIAVARVESLRTLVEGELEVLRKRNTELDLAAGSRVSLVRVISPATVPAYPASPKVLLNTMVGVFFGIALVLFAVVAYDTVGSTVNSTVDLRRVTGGDILPAVYPRVVRRAPKWERYSETGFIQDVDPYAKVFNRSLASLGGLNSGTIYVTGLVHEKDIINTSTVVSSAIALTGNDQIKVVPIPPLTTRFDWEALPQSNQKTVIICVVPPIEVEDQDIANVKNLIQRHRDQVVPLFVMFQK